MCSITGSRLIQVPPTPPPPSPLCLSALAPAFQLRRRPGVVTWSSPTRGNQKHGLHVGKFSPLSRLSQLRHSKTGPCMPSGAAGLCLLFRNFTDNRSWLGDSTLANKPKLKTNTPGWQDIMTTTTNHKSTDPLPINVESFMVHSRTNLIQHSTWEENPESRQGTRQMGSGWG